VHRRVLSERYYAQYHARFYDRILQLSSHLTSILERGLFKCILEKIFDIIKTNTVGAVILTQKSRYGCSPPIWIQSRIALNRIVGLICKLVTINRSIIVTTQQKFAWVLEEISSGGAVFEANRSYYGDGPYLDGLSVQFIADDSTRATGVRASILDFAETSLDEIKLATERFPELQTITSLSLAVSTRYKAR